MGRVRLVCVYHGRRGRAAWGNVAASAGGWSASRLFLPFDARELSVGDTCLD